MNLTRRYFLQTTGAVAAYMGVSPVSALAGVANARLKVGRVTSGKTLVVVFLRGGADGLNLVVPFADPHYAKLRPSIAIPAPGKAGGAIDLDGAFGLHPRLGALKEFFDSGLARAAHAVGYDKNTRSHFEEQDVWETGIIGNTVNSDGWVNRHLATSAGNGPIRAVAIGDSLPRILHGKAPAYAIRGVEDLSLPGRGRDREAIKAGLEHAYCTHAPKPSSGQVSDAKELLSQAVGATLEGIEQLKPLIANEYRPAAPYPETGIGRQLMQVARLIKAGVGVEVAEVDYGGWDTHQNQGQGATGEFGNLAGNLGEALAAFTRDLGDKMSDVLVVTLTDFGRTAAENGTSGTDHGWANCMLLIGGPVAAATKQGNTAKVLTKWPGLAPDQLHEKRDLLHTTDFRDVIAECVRVHLGNGNLEAVLPSHECKPVGLIASA
jgi:uncharacterized protein (DUF1501 family)